MPFGNSSPDGVGSGMFWLLPGAIEEFSLPLVGVTSLLSPGTTSEAPSGCELFLPGLPWPLYLTQPLKLAMMRGIKTNNNFFFIYTPSYFLNTETDHLVPPISPPALLGAPPIVLTLAKPSPGFIK